MSVKDNFIFVNALPRFGLGIVFLWFGIDKFIIHDFYVSWFSSTERVQAFIPIQDTSLAIYGIGIIEIIFAILFFTGIGIRWISIAAVIFMSVILVSAQYPSSYPQDIGLIGIAIMLAISNPTWKHTKTEKFLKFLWVVRFSIAAVLFLWAADQIVNIDRHVGWLLLSSPLSESLGAIEANSFLISISVVEIVLGVMMVVGKTTLTKYALVAVTIFFVFAIVLLEPPLNNHQTLGFVFVTAWLAYIAYSKNKV